MTETQRKALAVMDRGGFGSVFTALGWTWKADVRESQSAAQAVLDTLPALTALVEEERQTQWERRQR